ncbi:MAG: hypothetical protein JWQ33_1679 [Ramlibacter sp.]|nr:hypothetical protein [Ramlibacter sp.]
MGPLDLLLHLGGLLAPAAGVALLVSLLARPLFRGAGDQPWLRSFAIDFIAGGAALMAGLWLFGHDGKMLTYAALVLACASSQWLLARGWR